MIWLTEWQSSIITLVAVWQGAASINLAQQTLVDATVFILALISVFILLGFLRGLARELILTFFIIIAQVLLNRYFDSLVAWANRLYRMAFFALKGGLASDDPLAIWNSIQAMRPLVETQQDKVTFTLATLGAALIFGYIIGNVFSRGKLAPVGISLLWRPGALLPRLLGAVGGAVNGYLIVNYVVPRLLTEPRAVIVVPATKVSNVLQINLVNVAIALLVIIVIVGLQASGSRRR